MFSSSWTGQKDIITAPKPPLKSAKLTPEPIKAAVRSHMAEYTELAALIGVKSPNMGVEGFKEFLEANNITVFSLPEVISYMDAKAAKESKDKCGWEWRPLRMKDHREGLSIGTEATRTADGWSNQTRVREVTTVPASDYYKGPHDEGNGMGGTYKTNGSSAPYDRPIPLHALRKVALIEKAYTGDAAFFISDYALAPQVQYPDPFLMVVVPSLDAQLGIGRFVIDFWDEPGFGLDKQLS